MKKHWRIGVCAAAMSLLCACGNVLHVDKSIEPSELHSGKSINEAMNVVIGFFFFHYDGCTLKQLEYNEEFSTKRSDEWAEQYGADEAIDCYRSLRWITPAGTALWNRTAPIENGSGSLSGITGEHGV